LIETHEGAALVGLAFMEMTGASPGWDCGSFGGLARRRLESLRDPAAFYCDLRPDGPGREYRGEIRHPEIASGQETTTFEGPLGRQVWRFRNRRQMDVADLRDLHSSAEPVVSASHRWWICEPGHDEEPSIHGFASAAGRGDSRIRINVVTGMLFFVRERPEHEVACQYTIRPIIPQLPKRFRPRLAVPRA